jgi:glycosyltransferase involved in cell wall biosynthesis
VFVFPSVFEGWGIAVAEALACGAAVVAYDIPALREVFGECKSVFLVTVCRVDKMAQVVLNVLKLENKERLRKAAMDYAERFNWNKVAATDLQIITDTVLRNLRR